MAAVRFALIPYFIAVFLKLSETLPFMRESTIGPYAMQLAIVGVCVKMSFGLTQAIEQLYTASSEDGLD